MVWAFVAVVSDGGFLFIFVEVDRCHWIMVKSVCAYIALPFFYNQLNTHRSRRLNFLTRESFCIYFFIDLLLTPFDYGHYILMHRQLVRFSRFSFFFPINKPSTRRVNKLKSCHWSYNLRRKRRVMPSIEILFWFSFQKLTLNAIEAKPIPLVGHYQWRCGWEPVIRSSIASWLRLLTHDVIIAIRPIDKLEFILTNSIS